MSTFLNPILTLIYNQLSDFSGLENFWNLFETAFGTQYNRTVAATVRSQWQAGDFSEFPQIEIIDSSILGGANGAYASSTNKIYLSDTFVATATSAALISTLLEEYGHFVDAQINQTDSAGDEGAIFAELVQGNTLDAGTLQALKAEDDHATITVNGQIIQVEQQDFTGTAGNDNITGTSGDDVIRGLEGNDSINGGAGNDYLNSGTGNDTVNGGDGDDNFGGWGERETIEADQYIGGTGTDRLIFASGTTGISLTYTDINNGTFSTGGTIKEIEQFYFQGGAGNDNINAAATSYAELRGGAGNDTLIGGAGNDNLYGQDGNDSINGGDGGDFLYSGAGNDTVNGGDGDDYFGWSWERETIEADQYIGGTGTDRLSFASGTTGISLTYTDINNGTFSTGGTIKEIEQLYFLGGAGNDNINAAASSYAELRGGAGNDTLISGAGGDGLYGQDGDDSINGGAGNDYLNSGTGNDTLNGGDGDDQFGVWGEIETIEADQYIGGTGTDRLFFASGTTGISLTYTDINNGTFSTGGTIKEIEQLYFQGGAGNDNINAAASSYAELHGGEGNDTLISGAGGDNLYGGAGNDTLISGAGNDYLYGQDGNDSINGGAGDDQLYSGAGNDTLNGGDGDDYFGHWWGARETIEADQYIGGTGTDRLYFASGTTGISLTYTDINNGTFSTGGTIKEIERLDFQGGAGNDNINAAATSYAELLGGEGNDTLIGGAGGDNLSGQDGNDSINGGDGNDALSSGAGNDTVNGGAGDDNFGGWYVLEIIEADQYIGGTGTDRLTFVSGTTGISLTYTDINNGTFSTGGTIKEIEQFYFQGGAGNDNINAAASSYAELSGGAGNDTLIGGTGGDNLYGQDGNDSINGGAGNDYLYGQDGDDSINGGAGDDYLYSGAGNDTLNGGDGNDIFGVWWQPETIEADQYIGGTGTDRLIFASGTTGISLTYTDINNGTFSTGGTIKEIEELDFQGGAGNDNINAAATSYAVLRSGEGNDTLIGGAGNDHLDGQNGDDSINGGAGIDALYGGAGNDTVNGGTGRDDLYGQDGNDSINGGAGNDYLNGGDGDDNLRGANGDVGESDHLTGGIGADRFILGDSTWIGYDDGNNTTNGSNDCAYIADFNATQGDVIQLQGTSSNYLLAISGTDTQILIDKPGTEPDELIAIVGNQTGLSLTANYFVYNPLPSNITLALAPASVVEDGTTNLVYTFTRTGNIANALTVNYSVGGTATFNTDYTQAGAASFTATTGTITFAAGASTATLTIDPTADTTIENDETVALTLATGTDYTIGTTTAVTGTITNDDFPVITLAVAPASVLENGTTNLVYTFTRTGATTNALTVNYGITGTANSSDYTGATPGTGKIITFAAGASTATLTIDPTADSTIESNETVALTLATGTGYTIGTTTAVTGTITNDDFPVITLAVSPASVLENGTTNLVYTFTRTGATTNALTVNYGITGTANSSDYNGATPGTGKTITFAAGSSTATLTIDPTADTTIESNETVALTLATGTGYTIGTTTAVTGTITNDDFPSITLAVSPSSVTEDGTTNLVYTFTRTGPTTNALTVNYGITGTADSSDYTGATPGTGKIITFAAGSSTATLTIDPTADTTIENDETVALTLATGTGYTIGTTTAVTGTITNDDFPSITLAVSPSSVTEDGTTNLVYTFTRTGPTTNALTVNYGITGTADSSDYTGATPGTGKTITFAAGASTATLTIDPTADSTIESNETVALTLATGTGYTIGTTTAVTGTITNDDFPVITLEVAPSSVTEDGTTNLVYTFTRTGPTTNALTVNYGITGTADSSDYTGATPGTDKTITFAAGASTATLTIDPTADTTIENDETVALTLATGTGYNIGTTTAVTGTITNDDFPVITVAATDASAAETATGVTANPGIFTLTRTGSTTNALTVNYTLGGTASQGTDYSNLTGTVSFAAGSSTATVTVNPIDDNIFEGTENVILTLATGTGYTLGATSTATVNIADNDSQPTINLSASQTLVEGNTSPQNATYTVTLSNPSSQTITVNYATANGTATAGSDYTSTAGTLTFSPGQTSKVINIPILNDSINEANENFTLTLTSPTNASLGTNTTVTTTITDTLSASVTTTLPANVENLTLTGTAAINGTGNAGNNILRGNSANNTLSGGAGNDTYAFLANTALGTDTIVETTTGGTDTIDFTGTTAAVNVNLGVTTSQTVNSNLKLILSANNVIENATGGTGNDRITGNTLNNTLIGGSGNDQLQGLAGNDTLTGGSGNDILTGGSGDDLLSGELGDDILTGGVGQDKYLFQSTAVFSTSLGVDYITEFEVGSDSIVLSKTTFNAVTNTVGQAFTDFAVVSDDEFANASNGRIVYSQSTGSLFYNQDGNILGTGTVFEFARLGNLEITLSASDFTLIA